jgi:signal transduction histidine kinase
MRGIGRSLLAKGGLRRRILLWFLVLSLVPLFVSNAVGYLVTRRIIGEQVRRYLSALNEMQAGHVAHDIERHQLYLDAVLAGNNFILRNVPEASAELAAGRHEARAVVALHEHLDRKLAQMNPLSELLILDRAGVVVASTNHRLLGSDWAQRRVFRWGGRSAYFAEDREGGDNSDRPSYRLATPIQGAGGELVGVLVGTVELDKLHAFLRVPEHVAGDIHVFIVDQEGRPLFVSHEHQPIDYGAPLHSPLAISTGPSFERYVNYEGVEVLGTSSDVPGLPWRYISEVSVASAFGELRDLALLAGVLEAVFALLLVTIVWVVARSIVAPLRRLVTAAERIRAGELGVTVRIDRDDELGDLGRTFNQMSSGLERSAHEIQELHDQEMRRASQLATVGELASGVAHELKNPLVGALNGLDMVAQRLRKDPEADGILEKVGIQLQRIDSALRDLLSYARPKQPRLAPTDPAHLVDRVVSLVHPQAETAGVRIETQTDCPVPRIQVDPGQMTDALVNLSLNAIQAMRRGGLLTMSTDYTDESVRITVSDTGPGIEQDQLELIFRPFFTTKHRGTGLGLAITRGIIERHGGYIEVDTRPGEGSTFTLVFPVSRKEVALE